jgi:hypothetical protein
MLTLPRGPPETRRGLGRHDVRRGRTVRRTRAPTSPPTPAAKSGPGREVVSLTAVLPRPNKPSHWTLRGSSS